MSSVDLAELIAASRELTHDTRRALQDSANDNVRALAPELAPSPEGSAFTLALVGAYDAGKSTIVSALTGRLDVVIGADVTTSSVRAYRWSGIELLDTPGIHAGRPDHDALTNEAIDKADLLLYVVSNELFDVRLVKQFRSIVFERNRAAETMLVVNKMTQDAGTGADKLPDIAKVTDPFTPEDFRVNFIDARCALESRDALDVERNELLELANWGSFIGLVNRFVQSKGHIGRATQPLHGLMGLLAKAEALLAADEDSTEGMQLELLRRKRVILVENERRLRDGLHALTETSIGDIVTIGDQLAEALDPSADEKIIESTAKTAEKNASERVDKLVRTSAEMIEAALVALQKELDALAESALARKLDERLRASGDFAATPKLTAPTVNFKTAQKGAGAVEGAANWVTQLARGPGRVANELGAKAAAGSNLHKGVYQVGKFFGYKFKPWQAVNIAKNIGNVARVVGVVAGLLGPVFQIADDLHQEKVKRDLREARAKIRVGYRQSAIDVGAQVTTHSEALLGEVHGALIADVDANREAIIDKQRTRSAELRQLSDIARRVRQVLSRFNPAPLPA